MIHKFTMHGTNIVLDVNSGAVHVVDDISMEILDLYENAKKSFREKNIDKTNFSKFFWEEIYRKLNFKKNRYTLREAEETYAEIEELEKKGLLFSEDVFEENTSLFDDESIVKAMCLHISHDCNLRCEYCFASTGDFGKGRDFMSLEVGQKAIDFLIKSSKNRRNLEIDFFGGEPLMNFDVVKGITEYAKSKGKEHNKNFKFTLTTNAVLLNDHINDYLNKNMDNVVLSLDGRREVNDRMRKRLDGSGSYDRILPKIKEFVNSRNQENYYIRGTFTGKNTDFSKDVIHLADLGFKQISVEPVVAAKNEGYEITEKHLPELYDEYEKLAKEYVKRMKTENWFNFFHFMMDLQGGPCIAKRLSGCGAGHEYVAVTPKGDIYPCHQFVGMDDMKLGSVFGGLLKEDIQSKFRNTSVYKKEKCRDCFARFYCSGGCAANAYQFKNDINIPYDIGCELEKKRVECALWCKSQLSDI